MNINDFKQFEVIRAAREGDLRPLATLLRSEDQITVIVREYLAEEIERDAGKRFRQKTKRLTSQIKNDEFLLYKVWIAKVFALDAIFPGGTDDERHSFIFENLASIGDDAACDAWATMLQRGIVDGDIIDVDSIRNVRKRSKGSFYNIK